MSRELDAVEKYFRDKPAGDSLGYLVIAFESGAWTLREGMADLMDLDTARRYRLGLIEDDPRTPYAIVDLHRVTSPEQDNP